MTTTNAWDWRVDAGRLLSEDCRHGIAALKRCDCRSCLTEALTAAYEAGRADAGALPKCHCESDPSLDATPCDCCGAKEGEPCRHEVCDAPRS